ncbi:MAG TPA: hypothetical protein VFR06_09305 [Gallionellaceae bacterium]|nr:hypothetical protein [Gallionellaceae bacterium]
MRKPILALAGVMLGSLFVTSASALPLFARQTGFACSQCHFQHFPLLNAYGRSFKAGGFTMMGAQPKVEGEALSIPDRLNMGVLTTLGVENVSGPENATYKNSANTPGGGGELSLFFGGRVSDNVGFLAEMGTAGTAGMTAAKLPMFYEVAEGTRAGLVFVTTNGQGAAHSFETLNTGAAAVHRMAPTPGQNANNAHTRANSAAQYLGTNTAAQGASFVVNNKRYFVNAGKYAIPAAMGSNTQGGAMRMTYMRAAAMFDVADFDSAAGVQAFRGDDGVEGGMTGTEATIIDGQMQGAFDKYPLGLYVSYGTAPVVNNATAVGNKFNAGGAVTSSSLNIAVELGVVPGVATVMAAVRMAKNGGIDANGADATDNAVMVGMTYDLAMNVEASLSYTRQSGTKWDAPAGGVEPAGKAVTTLILEALF